MLHTSFFYGQKENTIAFFYGPGRKPEHSEVHNYFKGFQLNLLKWIKLFISTPSFSFVHMCVCQDTRNVIYEATHIPRKGYAISHRHKTFFHYLPNNAILFLWLLFLESFFLIINFFRSGNLTPDAVWSGIPAQWDLANSQVFCDYKLQL